MYISPTISSYTQNNDINGTVTLEENTGTKTTWSVNISEFLKRPRQQGRMRIKLKANYNNTTLQVADRALQLGITVSNNIDFAYNPELNQYVLNGDTETFSEIPILYYLTRIANSTYYFETDFNVFISANQSIPPWSHVINDKWYFKICIKAIGDDILPSNQYTIEMSNASIEISFADDPDTNPNLPPPPR